MGTLQDQLASGSKISRPSDDPTAAVKGMGYRSTLTQNGQFSRNMNEVNGWLEASDTALTETNNALQRVKDLTIQASTDSVTSDDRQAILKEIDQIRLQLRDIANTQQGDKYIFSGTDTTTPLYSTPNEDGGADDVLPVLNGNNNTVDIEVYNGVTFSVNTPGKDTFSSIDEMMKNLQMALNDPTSTGSDIETFITQSTKLSDKVLQLQASVGAKENRVDTMMDRLSTQNISVTKQLSNNEDVEYEDAITQLITEQSTHQAALSVGSKIIQATLVDFL